MEEISSLDSIPTDSGDTIPVTHETTQPQSEKDKEAAETKDSKKSVTNVGADAEEEFEEISDGTFELDENSGPPPDDCSQDKNVSEKEIVDEDVTHADEAIDEEHDKSADFEEVDANVSANVGQSEESDMLGESDMTLPIHGDKSTNEMEVDNVENEAEEPTTTTTTAGDVEMESLSNSPDGKKSAEVENDIADDTMAEIEEKQDVESQDTEDGGKDVVDADIEADDNNEVERSKDVDDELEDTKNLDDDVGRSKDDDDDEVEQSEVVDNDVEHSKADDEEVEHAKAANEEEQTNEDEHEQSKNNEIDEEDKAVEKDKSVTEDQEKDPADAEENGEEEHEQENESVENVQEPEESDVCLIPDDTETEVTEAEKEQAILARENAEKADAEAEAEAEAEKVKDKETEADKEATENEISEKAADEETNETLPITESSEAPDPDEPLLEEMQSTATGETGTTLKIIIAWIVATQKKCKQCDEIKTCGFRYKNPENPGEFEYVCNQACCDAILTANPGKYFIRRKKYLVEELTNETTNVSKKLECLQCKETKVCKYFFKQDDDAFYVCNDDCYNLLNAEEPDKFKLKRHSIRVRNIGATTITGTSTSKKTAGTDARVVARTATEAEAARLERVASFLRRCAECFTEVVLGDKNLLWETMDFCNEICLGKYQRTIGANCQTCRGDVPHQALGKYCVRFGFDIRQFCCAVCLNEFKKGLKTCSCCQKDISSGSEGFLAPVGDKEQFKDFCSQACLRRYDNMCNPKKKLRNDICAVCNHDKPVRVEILLDGKEHYFCSNPCFSAFKFVSNIVADQCSMCSKYFERKGTESYSIYTERRAKVYCSRICLNVYIIVNRHIVSCQWCKVKKYNFDMIYKKQDSQEVLMCSLNCLTLYGVSINAFSRTVAKCDNCGNSATPQYHLTMSDASMRNFCTYQCVMQFQSQFARAPLTLDSEAQQPQQQQQQLQSQQQQQQCATAQANNNAPFPTGLPKRVKLKVSQQVQPIKLPTKNNTTPKQKISSLPVISTVSSLASGETETMIGNVTVRRSRIRGRKLDSPPPLVPVSNTVTTPTPAANARGRLRKTIDYTPTSTTPPPVPSPPSRNNNPKRGSITITPATADKNITNASNETKIIAVPPYPASVRNVQTLCKPSCSTVGIQNEPATADAGTQTSKDYSNKILIPVPVPIYIPQPMYMYSAPFPVPIPIPLPIPVPIFIPTTRNSAQGILKEIKKIQDKMPADPFEAELLMMAEMVAEEKRDSDSGSDEEVIKAEPGVISIQYDNVQQTVEVPNNSYGEDVLQMALKMATGEYDQPTVDLESAMTANTITNPPPGVVGHEDSIGHMQNLQQQQQIIEPQRAGRGRKRNAIGANISSPILQRNSRSPAKRQRLMELDQSPQTTVVVQSTEKPDANMCLKYTFGVNAWKQWVMTKNSDFEKSTIRRRPFKTELLQMTADELNYSLCLFVKEVRKPNGTEYAPDTIYYLVLGIQQYLYENGRIDNIFTDPYYERFTDCLDEVARKFSVLYNDSQYIVTRVEEEHLWECKQLGAHSPHVLLSTLMFFNTKHFNLTSVEEHMQLSFSHIMKHWKRSAQNTKTPGTRNVLLRFYPPQSGLDANPRKKKVYEQQENEENPLRCPVRLYEFYLSKCPESVKTRNDVFYLQPERSCVPDSPVWYSTQALSQDALQKMLHRVKMVKEINIALLTS